MSSLLMQAAQSAAQADGLAAPPPPNLPPSSSSNSDAKADTPDNTNHSTLQQEQQQRPPPSSHAAGGQGQVSAQGQTQRQVLTTKHPGPPPSSSAGTNSNGNANPNASAAVSSAVGGKNKGPPLRRGYVLTYKVKSAHSFSQYGKVLEALISAGNSHIDCRASKSFFFYIENGHQVKYLKNKGELFSVVTIPYVDTSENLFVNSQCSSPFLRYGSFFHIQRKKHTPTDLFKSSKQGSSLLLMGRLFELFSANCSTVTPCASPKSL